MEYMYTIKRVPLFPANLVYCSMKTNFLEEEEFPCWTNSQGECLRTWGIHHVYPAARPNANLVRLGVDVSQRYNYKNVVEIHSWRWIIQRVYLVWGPDTHKWSGGPFKLENETKMFSMDRSYDEGSGAMTRIGWSRRRRYQYGIPVFVNATCGRTRTLQLWNGFGLSRILPPLYRYQGKVLPSKFLNNPCAVLSNALIVPRSDEADCSVVCHASGPPISVLTQPGWMLTARMPSSSTSMLRVLVKWLRADWVVGNKQRERERERESWLRFDCPMPTITPTV